MKALLLLVVISSLSTLSTQTLAGPGAQLQRNLGSDHIINRVAEAKNTIEKMTDKHQVMTKDEILTDVEEMISTKKGSIKRSERSDYLADAQKFLELLKSQDTASDMLILEQDLVNELNDFEYSAYMSVSSQVQGEGAIVGLIFTLPMDLIFAPFQAIGNGIQYNQTKWYREAVKFLIKY
jgi:hypothetical protein